MFVQSLVWKLLLAPGLLLGDFTFAYLPASYWRCNATGWATIASYGTLALLALSGAFGEETFMTSSVLGGLFAFAFMFMYVELRYEHMKQTEQWGEDKRTLTLHEEAVKKLLDDWPMALEVTANSPWNNKESVSDLWKKLKAQVDARRGRF